MITSEYEKMISDPAGKERVINWDEDGSISVTVVTTVSEITGEDVTEMEPLSTVVDTDSLDDLFEPTNRSPRKWGSIEFEYCGCLVRITAADQLVVVPPSEW